MGVDDGRDQVRPWHWWEITLVLALCVVIAALCGGMPEMGAWP